MTAPLATILLGLGALLLGVAVVAALRWYELQADECVRVARHARRVAVDQEAREGEPPAIDRTDRGVRARMNASRGDALKPIVECWRWVLVIFVLGMGA